MNVMSAERLEELCLAIRYEGMACDDELVSAIEADVEQYQLLPVTQVPPDEMSKLLPVMGWLMYEATFDGLKRIPNRFKETGGDAAARAQANYEFITRVTNAARNLPWPEYAIRALGAFRAQALAESKQDTQASYVRAQTVHLEARNRHASFLSYHRKFDPDEKDAHLRSLDEVFVQLVLAETGTACRTAERIIDRWAEEFQPVDDAEDRRLREQYIQLIFDQMSHGADIGEQALEAAERVAKYHGFVDKVTRTGLAQPESFVNLGIMTARAVLLLLAFYPEMERLGFYPLGEDDTWDQSRERLRKRFDNAYRYLERPVRTSDGNRRELRDDLKLAIVHVRLAAALTMPGRTLPSSLTFAPCLSHQVLDDKAVEAMCEWLTETVIDRHGRQTQRSTYRGFGGAIMPNFIDGVEACRVAFGGEPGYRAWRARWFILDKYANEPGRDERLSKVLGLPVTRERPI
jgi:hypothetical protein